MDFARKIYRFFTNFYLLSGSVFLVWMLFFDKNDLGNQSWLFSKKRELSNQKEYYQEKIAEVTKEREQLFSNNSLLEKFAREKYLMHKPGEDVFILKIEE
ncbi:MAG: septum formation initiator family protein [Cytophagales bacterium]